MNNPTRANARTALISEATFLPSAKSNKANNNPRTKESFNSATLLPKKCFALVRGCRCYRCSLQHPSQKDNPPPAKTPPLHLLHPLLGICAMRRPLVLNDARVVVVDGRRSGVNPLSSLCCKRQRIDRAHAYGTGRLVDELRAGVRTHGQRRPVRAQQAQQHLGHTLGTSQVHPSWESCQAEREPTGSLSVCVQPRTENQP